MSRTAQDVRLHELSVSSLTGTPKRRNLSSSDQTRRFKELAFRAVEVPGGARLHYFLQRHVTRNWPRPAQTLDSLAGVARRVIDDCLRHRGEAPSAVIEVGAGRDLAVPLALRRLGGRTVIACEVERLARLDLVQHAADALLADPVCLRDWDELQRFGIDYSDHYARSDRSVSRLNFLRYSDDTWRPFNSGRQFVNRLRHSDYVRMFRAAGFTILEESATPGQPPDDLAIAEQFRRYQPDDLFAIKGRIIAA